MSERSEMKDMESGIATVAVHGEADPVTSV
jgi:hypothetical protein